MGTSDSVAITVPAGMFTSFSVRFEKRAMPFAVEFGTAISLAVASDCSALTVTDNFLAGTLPVIETNCTDSLAATGMIADWTCDSGNKVTVALGMNRPATAKTALTPTVNVTILPTRDVLQAGSLSYTSSRIRRRSRRGAFGTRWLLEAGSGHRALCAAAVESKTGIARASASRRTFARRVTRPSCAPSETACRCKTFKSSKRKVTFSYFGHTSRMRGVFAHDNLSRTEIRSSWDSSVMICVFKKEPG